ncbi:hypothetical protein KIN20_019000 [Parelaphostrongylus tenuis]|uniref:Uncharacterized protein n=1 Tax=Parelaphostrongylus tenuis TaxID=148309 RepID=A0AAD5N855_PARTN|nr:hypothetical protein KIN20_019000 [Parelaphostrongylus tenuis]
MIRSKGECPADRQEEEDERSFGFRRATANINDQYSPDIYLAEGEPLADIDDIADEVEVQHSVATDWSTATPPSDVNKPFAPATVLLTTESLRSRPQHFVGSRNSAHFRNGDSSQWEDPSDIPSTSSASQRMPGMKPLFKMYGEAALRKAEQADLLHVDDSAQKGEEALFAPLPCKEALVIDEEAAGSDFIALGADHFYSKRKHFIHKFHEWPLYWDRPVDFQEACLILMGAIFVHENKICMSMPQGFRGEGTFVVNCEQLQQCDSNNDGMGSWGRPTGRSRFYRHLDGLVTRMDDGRGNLLPNAKYVWKCMMRRYEHPLTANVAGGQNRFIKKVYTALCPPEHKEAAQLVVLTYEWIGKPFDFRVPSSFVKSRRVGQLAPRPPVGTKDWQTASFHGGPMAALPANCSAYFGDCPLYAVGAIDFSAAASIILGGTIVDSSRICNRVPQGYRECGTFVIDLNNFVSDAELRRDNNGCWGKPAGNSREYKIDSSTGDAVRVDRGCKLIEGAEYDVQILSKRYEHPSVNGRFVRKIYTARNQADTRMFEPYMSLAVMTYFWKGDPEYFEVGPQRKVRISEGVERLRSLDMPYATHSDQRCFVDNVRAGGPQPVKRPRIDPEEEELGNGTRAMLYRAEYELQERQAALLDRFEACIERLERFLPQLPSVQQVWLNGAPHGDNSVAHEEEIIIEDEAYGEDYVTDLSETL